ncbi:apolipoprotein A1/A4/E domain protein [Moorella thermoacetica]|uniref:Apolipoprotein A1/A4/E domain protein n=1 Tax=Neomoorella thermoacetica TaxID=1525 RepID=A0A1J5NZR5_NEOTH|nr:apolipoprotein A1/A4/E domain protein [Moorella thermoacetica]
MSAMPEESLREIAATNEPPHTLASPEFFFLLQRIDRLDEKLTREIRDGDQRSEELITAVDQKLTQRIDALEQKLTRHIEEVEQKLTQRIDAVEQKLTRRMDALEEKLGLRIDKQDDKLNSLKFWAIGAVITISVGFIGTIATLLYK